MADLLEGVVDFVGLLFGGPGGSPVPPGMSPSQYVLQQTAGLREQIVRDAIARLPPSVPLPDAPALPPSLDLPPPVLPGPGLDVLPLPTPLGGTDYGVAAPSLQGLLLRAGRSSGESRRRVAAEDQAYGRRVRRIARRIMRRGTRLAQGPSPVLTEPPFFPPVPSSGLPPPPPAIDEQAGPRRPTRRARGARGGVGAGVVVGGEGIAEGIGQIAGEVAAEAIHGDELREAERIAAQKERELADRYRELEEGWAILSQGVPTPPNRYGFPSEHISGDRVADQILRRAQTRTVPIPMPQLPPAQLPPVSGQRPSRLRRVLSRIASARSSKLGRALTGVSIAQQLYQSRRRGGGFTAQPIALGDAIVPPPATLPSGPSVTPGMLPFTPGQPMTFTGGGGGVVTGSRTQGCDCKPKRRGKPRKCLERGAVAWRTGRYKGRAAGTKCIRWAN